MTSKWIKEVNELAIYETDEDWLKILKILERIDNLLKLAMLETDNETLQEDILKETISNE